MDISMSYNNATFQLNYASWHVINFFNFRTKVLIFIIVSAFLLSSCQSNGKKPDVKAPVMSSEIANFTPQQELNYNKALEYLNSKKNHSEAEALLLKLTEQQPNLPGPWANLGLLNLLQKKPVEAENFVKRALKINPKMSQALNLMGLIATHNRDIKSAENYYLEAIAIKKDYSNAHYNLALLYDIYLQDIRKAAKHYRHYLRSINNKDEITLNWTEQLERSLTR